MTIFAVVATKGGVGKTTTAVHLATLLAEHHKTLLVDGDAQKSSMSWSVWRRESKTELPSPTTVMLEGKSIRDEGRDLSSGYEHTVVDVGGRDGSGLRSALILANVAIVPCGASSLDGAALTDLLEVVDLAKDINPSLKLKVLLTRIDTRTKDTAAMEAYLRENHLEVLNTKIYERVAYRRSIADGATVTEKPLKDEQANLEMRHFFAEVNQ